MTNRGPLPGAWARPIAMIARIVIGVALVVYTLLDELLFPVFRPIMRWLGGLKLSTRLGRLIGRSPPYVVLALLAMPLAVIEPAKVYALLLIATGHVILGTVVLLIAQIGSLLICERIYHAGRGQLQRIGWFTTMMGWLVSLRNRALSLLRGTEFWQALSRWVRRLRTRLRSVWRLVLRQMPR